MKGAEHDNAADGYDRDRRFVPAKSALCRLGETEEVALLHEAMNSLGRALHKEGVAKGQLNIFEMFAQVFSLTMDGKDMNAVLLPKIEVTECLAEKGGAVPDDSFHEDGFAFAGGGNAELGFRLEKHTGHFLDSLDSGDWGLQQQLVTGGKAKIVERPLDPLAVAHHADDPRLAQPGQRRLGDGFPDEWRGTADHRLGEK